MYTDNNPLTYVLTSAKIDATGQKWVASLANYDFTIHYWSGKQNREADALSRVKWEHNDAVVVKAILARGFIANMTIPHPFDSKTVRIGNVDFKLSTNDWVKEQSADVDIGPVVELVKSNRHLQYTCKKGIRLGCVYY